MQTGSREGSRQINNRCEILTSHIFFSFILYQKCLARIRIKLNFSFFYCHYITQHIRNAKIKHLDKCMLEQVVNLVSIHTDLVCKKKI